MPKRDKRLLVGIAVLAEARAPVDVARVEPDACAATAAPPVARAAAFTASTPTPVKSTAPCA